MADDKGTRSQRSEDKEEDENESCRGIRVRGMQFAYDGHPPLFVDFSIKISTGSRCLLGRPLLQKILVGKHMVGGRDVERVLNCSAFHDTQLVCNGDLAHLGGSWSKTVGSAGEIPLHGDFSAEHIIFGVEGTDPERRDKLIELLDIIYSGECIRYLMGSGPSANLHGSSSSI